MIDYLKLANSVQHYEGLSFVRIEVPWMVTAQIAELTKPPNAFDYHVQDIKKVLVASAEQSFLYLATKDQLPKGKYQAITPCFRYEPIDLTHRKCFMKNELINTESVSNESLMEIIQGALKFYQQYINIDRLKIVEAEAHKAIINYDIVAIVNGQEMELGSYGIRKSEVLKYIYGTGCAEPRLSLIMKKIELED